MTVPLQAQSPLPPAVLVCDQSGLEALAGDLSTESLIAVDTESNSLYAYRERVCVIQFSTPQKDFILDPLCFSDLSLLASLFANPAQQKVFHAAEYDIAGLSRDYGFEFAGIFDTMLAARTLGWQQTGLATILETRFGVKTMKKFQRADWTRRPLSAEHLEYARMDTHFLLRLRALQIEELLKRDRLAEAQQQFSQLERVKVSKKSFDEDRFWRIHGAQALNMRQLAVLKELYLYRETLAKKADRPPFKIFGEQVLIEVARIIPSQRQQLTNIPGLSPNLIRRYGNGILHAVSRGRSAPNPVKRKIDRLPLHVRQRHQRLKEWRTEKARSRGVESDIILSRDLLWTLAKNPPGTLQELAEFEHIGVWHVETYGLEILQVLKEDQQDRPSETTE